LSVSLDPATSIRHSRSALAIRPTSSVVAEVIAAVRQRLQQEGSIGVIATNDRLRAIERELARAGIESARVEDGIGSRLELVPVELCKGLEFDHVVVVEPAEIVRSYARGLHWLYVALTRVVSSLDVVHGEDLPVELAA
jgi:DNA helicase IV